MPRFNRQGNSMQSDEIQRGQWALITGASMGLGEAFARRLAAAGCNCVLVALEQDRLDALAAELTDLHEVKCRPIALDLTRDDMLDRIQAATHDIAIDILVNNAGFGVGGPFATRDPGRLAALVKLNCLAPVLLTRHFLPGMLDRNYGAIIMVASIMAFITAPYETAYNASKAFGLHFGESLWGELRGTGVDVITVCPGGMKTAFFAGEGIRASDVRRLHRFSHPPDKMAGLALRHLGRKPVVAPPFPVISSLLVRMLPRRWVTNVVRQIMLRFVRYDEAG
jgi:uncharacterized protein